MLTQTKVMVTVKGQYFAFSTDCWTSLANIGYVTCTAHFTDKLHVSYTLWSWVSSKNGSSTAKDVVSFLH